MALCAGRLALCGESHRAGGSWTCMREYEIVVVYDLAVAEAGGQDAAAGHLSGLIETRGGKLLKLDHWGRRRMAYPINRALDGDYVLARAEIEPSEISPLEASLRLNERVYRHLVVRADELPVPPPPREPRVPPGERADAAAVTASEEPAAAVTEPLTSNEVEEVVEAAIMAEQPPVDEGPAVAEAAADGDTPSAEDVVEAAIVAEPPVDSAEPGPDDGGEETTQPDQPKTDA